MSAANASTSATRRRLRRGPRERDLRHGLRERCRHLVRRRRDPAKQGVHLAEARELLRRPVAADELAEVRRLSHGFTSSSRPARRASPVRVLVFTVPRGTSR